MDLRTGDQYRLDRLVSPFSGWFETLGDDPSDPKASRISMGAAIPFRLVVPIDFVDGDEQRPSAGAWVESREGWCVIHSGYVGRP